MLPVDSSQVVITSGAVRLANRNPAALIDQAKNLCLGSAAKEIKQATIGAPANRGVKHTTTIRAVALLVRVCGAPNVFRRGPVTLKIERDNTADPLDNTLVPNGTEVTTFTVYPASSDAMVLVLLTSDNGGVGQLTGFTGLGTEFTTAANPAATAEEYVISSEVITLRDFTVRENV